MIGRKGPVNNSHCLISLNISSENNEFGFNSFQKIDFSKLYLWPLDQEYVSDCRSRSHEFNPRPVPYFRGDWSWNNFYSHSPPFCWFKKGCLSVRSKKLAQEKNDHSCWLGHKKSKTKKYLSNCTLLLLFSVFLVKCGVHICCNIHWEQVLLSVVSWVFSASYKVSALYLLHIVTVHSKYIVIMSKIIHTQLKRRITDIQHRFR